MAHLSAIWLLFQSIACDSWTLKCTPCCSHLSFLLHSTGMCRRAALHAVLRYKAADGKRANRRHHRRGALLAQRGQAHPTADWLQAAGQCVPSVCVYCLTSHNASTVSHQPPPQTRKIHWGQVFDFGSIHEHTPERKGSKWCISQLRYNGSLDRWECFRAVPFTPINIQPVESEG